MMNTKEFISQRNDAIFLRIKELECNFKIKECKDIISKEFNLSTSRVKAIIRIEKLKNNNTYVPFRTERNLLILADLDSNMTNAEVAAKYNLKVSSIRKIISERNRKNKVEEKEEIKFEMLDNTFFNLEKNMLAFCEQNKRRTYENPAI